MFQKVLQREMMMMMIRRTLMSPRLSLRTTKSPIPMRIMLSWTTT
jgi:hypothetical protein